MIFKFSEFAETQGGYTCPDWTWTKRGRADQNQGFPFHQTR